MNAIQIKQLILQLREMEYSPEKILYTIEEKLDEYFGFSDIPGSITVSPKIAIVGAGEDSLKITNTIVGMTDIEPIFIVKSPNKELEKDIETLLIGESTLIKQRFEIQNSIEPIFSDLEPEKALKHGHYENVRTETKYNRNALCHCGSGLKIKKCCLKKETK